MQSLWCEDYRPKSLSEIVLEPTSLSFFQKCLEDKSIPHLLLVGKCGTGKTTMAKLLINVLDAESKELNASDERGIDTMRDEVKTFLMLDTVKKYKIVFLDEADMLCLEENTLIKVLREKGRFEDVKIKDLCGKTFKVASMNTSGCLESIEAICVDNGEEDVYVVELEDGRQVLASQQHPFFRKVKKERSGVGQRFSWVLGTTRVRDLNPGDSIIDLNCSEPLKVCLVCNRILKGTEGLVRHFKFAHKLSQKEYYDKYLKSEFEGVCKNCGKVTRFADMVYGYQYTCSSSCCGKVARRAPHSPMSLITKEKIAKTHREHGSYEDYFGKSKAVELKKRLRISHQLFYATPEGKRVIELAAKKQRGKKKPGVTRALLGSKQSLITRQKKSIKSKLAWGSLTKEQFEKRVSRTLDSIHKGWGGKVISSYEQQIIDLVGKYKLPFVFTGGGTYRKFVGKKIPDFIGNNGAKVLVEVYSKSHLGNLKPLNYETERAHYFSNYGYSVVFLTEDDLFCNDWELHCLKKLCGGNDALS